MKNIKNLLCRAGGFIRKAAEDCHIRITDFFAALFTAFICADFYVASLGSFDDLTYIRDVSAGKFFFLFFLVLAALWAAVFILKTTRIISWCFFISALLFACLLAYSAPQDIFFALGLAFVLAFVVKYVTAYNRLGINGITISRRASFLITALLFSVFMLFVVFITYFQWKSFSYGTFDFGIFAQMFEQMAKTGLPLTTVERGGELSHFAVHFSPVFYLLLPGYLLFRSPLYLLGAQAFMVGFGVFPLRRICLKLGFSPALSAAMCGVYVLFPTMSGGCFYDFHENKFLSVFLLYMIYFILCDKKWAVLVFALATLSVKEDAAIYVIAVALWMLLSRRSKLFAVILCLVSAAYFIFACKMIQLSGGEIMMSRLNNFYASGNGGFLDVIKTCLYDIGYLIKEVFSGANPERFSEIAYTGQKLEFVLWLCIPLAFTPFASRHSTHLVLLIPMVVINLMSDWMYQFNPMYQYTYGTAALLIASAALTLSEKTTLQRRRLTVAMLSLSLLFFCSLSLPKAVRYPALYRHNSNSYEQTAEALKTIPSDASVTAYGYFVPRLSHVDRLTTCPKYYGDYEQTDYCVIDTRYKTSKHTSALLECMGDDYELVLARGFAEIYKLK